MNGAFEVDAQVNKKLQMLERLTEQGSTDPFVWYALALEYRGLQRFDEALQTFTTLRARHPDYVPMYLMCTQMLDGLGRKDEARDWCETGIEASRKKGDGHALAELQTALSLISQPE